MPRNYTKKTNPRALWSSESLNSALRAIKNGMSQRQASRSFGIPKTTLLDYMKRSNQTGTIPSKKQMGGAPVFTPDQEKEIKEYVLLLSKLFYGITKTELRKLAYDFAIANNIPNCFDKQKQLAGVEWYYGFMSRNSDISLRKPEPTSISRVIGLNRTAVKIFFDNVKEVHTLYNFEPAQIYNVDESGLSTVQNPQKILAQKGQHQVGKICSAERGQNITVICCVNAVGTNYIPPLFVFPRVRMNPCLMNGSPPQSIAMTSHNGWSNEEIFVKWLQHFIKYAGSSTEKKVLLILDNHESHVNIAVYNTCLENGIVLLTIPPHTSHRLQPLDLTFFGPLKTSYYKECDNFMTSNPGRRITQFEVAMIFGKAYIKCCTMEKAINGFKKAGITPFDPDVISEEEFSAADHLKPVEYDQSIDNPQSLTDSTTTAHASPHDTQPNTNFPSTDNPQSLTDSTATAHASPSIQPMTNSQVKPLTDYPIISDMPSTSSYIQPMTNYHINSVRTSTLSPNIQPIVNSSTSTSCNHLNAQMSANSSGERISIIDLTPISSLRSLPKHIKGKSSGRKAGKSCIVTSPEMKSILEAKQLKRINETVKNKVTKKKKKTIYSVSHKIDDAENFCCVCQSNWKDTDEEWLKCVKCLKWACESCFSANECALCCSAK